jgi:enoyl-CoA hydratase
MADADAGISLAIEDHIAIVTIDRPPVNAVDRDAHVAIRRAFDSLNDNQDVRVAIFTAVGDRAFMAGADLRTINKRPENVPPTGITDPARYARDAFWSITDCAVPVIGAINGPALGAGLAYAACCDILIASENATFGTTEINVGLLGASSHLSTLVGRHKARELFFTGETISAAELYRLGSLRAVVAREDLMDATMELARSLAAKSPIALRLAKESMNRVEDLPLKEGYRTEQDYTARLLRFEDAKEANAAFLEKRPPEWKWK